MGHIFLNFWPKGSHWTSQDIISYGQCYLLVTLYNMTVRPYCWWQYILISLSMGKLSWCLRHPYWLVFIVLEGIMTHCWWRKVIRNLTEQWKLWAKIAAWCNRGTHIMWVTNHMTKPNQTSLTWKLLKYSSNWHGLSVYTFWIPGKHSQVFTNWILESVLF